MISASKISLFLGSRQLYKEVSFTIKKTDKIGLAGKNGAGKSTMLKLITGEYTIDEGQISIEKGLRVCYLPQEIISRSSSPIIEEVVNSNGELLAINERLEEINVQLSTREDYESESYLGLLDELNDLNDAFNRQGGAELQESAELILKGLGFDQSELHTPMDQFSGGWQMRVELAKLLVQNPDMLLLDEPTNHLDIESIEWLEGYLKKFTGAIILISHDRKFLDNITNRTIEINGGKLYDYKLAYSKYLLKREEELELQLKAFQNQQKTIEDTEKLINKFRAKKNKAAFAQSLIKKLDKMDKIELDNVDRSALAFRFPEPVPSGKLVAEMEGVGFEYPGKSIFEGIRLNIAKGEKIALIGKNGMGKSTFIKLLVNAVKPTGDIRLGHNVNVGYFAQDETAKLDGDKTVFETIDDVAVGEVRKRIRAILGSFLFDEDAIEKKVKVLSGGEKTRLALCKLLLEPYNFLILDEPTNHLDIISKDVLKEALQGYTGTLLLVSHDRDFLDGISDRIYYIKNKQISIYFDPVNDFLKTISSDSQSKADGKKEKAKEKKPNSYQQQKELKSELRKSKNKLSNLEKDIDRLERVIKENEGKITESTPQDEMNKLFSSLSEDRSTLDRCLADWEVVSERILELEEELS